MASWFIANRKKENPVSQERKTEGLEKGDTLPKLTRIDPIEVTIIITMSIKIESNISLLALLFYKENRLVVIFNRCRRYRFCLISI